MRDINSVALVGRLTKDAEYKTVSERTVATISLASSRDKDETDFFEVSYWGKGAEAVREYLKKGRQVVVNGRLRQNRWENNGQKQSKIIVVAESVQLVGGNSASQEKPAPVEDIEDIPF